MLRVIAASHQCGSGSNPGVDVIMWIEFARSLLCYEKFFSGYFDFLLSSKINVFKYQFDKESGR